VFQGRLLDEKFIVLVLKNDSELTPATVHKHIDIVRQQLKIKAVLYIPPFHRLIENG